MRGARWAVGLSLLFWWSWLFGAPAVLAQTPEPTPEPCCCQVVVDLDAVGTLLPAVEAVGTAVVRGSDPVATVAAVSVGMSDLISDSVVVEGVGLVSVVAGGLGAVSRIAWGVLVVVGGVLAAVIGGVLVSWARR